MAKAIDFNVLTTNAKRARQFIAGKVTAYNNASIGMHHAACVAFFHAAEYGNPDLLTFFYAELSKNNQTALKLWAGKLASYTEGGDDKVKHWLAFTIKGDVGAFKTPAGKSEHRVGQFTIGELIDGPSFLAVDNDKEKPAVTLEALIAMIGKAAANVETKADNNDISIPSDVRSFLLEVGKKSAELKAAHHTVN